MNETEVFVLLTDGTEHSVMVAGSLPVTSDADEEWFETVVIPALREAALNPDNVDDWWV